MKLNGAIGTIFEDAEVVIVGGDIDTIFNGTTGRAVHIVKISLRQVRGNSSMQL